MSVERDYNNALNYEEINAEEPDDEDDEATLPGEEATPAELNEAREEIAEEEQPDDSHLPGTEKQTVDWRGTELEFAELGDTMDTIAMMESDPEKGEGHMAAFARERLGEKCTDPAANAAYWQQFDLQRSDDTDGLMDIIQRLTGAASTEQRERAEKFR